MTMALQSLLFMGAVSMAFAALTLAPRWAQLLFTVGGVGASAILLAQAALHLAPGLLLAALMMLAMFLGLDRVLLELRRPLPGATPGGADAPGASGKRAEARTASGPGVSSLEQTAERLAAEQPSVTGRGAAATRSCAFLARGR